MAGRCRRAPESRTRRADSHLGDVVYLRCAVLVQWAMILLSIYNSSKRGVRQWRESTIGLSRPLSFVLSFATYALRYTVIA